MYWIDKLDENGKSARIKKVLETTNLLGEKIESLDVKRKSTLMIAADLGDLYQYADDLRVLIQLLIETPSTQNEKLADIFVSLDVILGEIKNHATHARPGLRNLADHCYNDSSKKREGK
jgi:hypothetical protein